MRSSSGLALAALAVAGIAGVALLGDSASSTSVKPLRPVLARRFPQGKGLLVRSLRHGGSPQLLAKRCSYLGVQWLAVEMIHQHPDGTDTVYLDGSWAEYRAELEVVGVDLWGWGWPRPARQEAFVQRAIEGVAALGAKGFLVNAEAPYYGRKHRDAAARLMDDLIDGLGNRPVGSILYGAPPSWHPSFPWDEFAGRSELILPMLYDTKHKLAKTHQQSTVKALKRRWPTAAVVPLWGASNAHSPEQMEEISNRTPVTDGAAAWWDLYWLLLSKGRSEFVRRYTVPTKGAEVA